MQQFTFLVAQALSAKIGTLTKHAADVADLMTRHEQNPNPLSLHIAGWQRQGVEMMPEYMPITPNKVVESYRRDINANIEQMRYNFQQLNDDSAPHVNQRFNLNVADPANAMAAG